MREFSVPASVRVDDGDTLTDTVFAPGRRASRRRRGAPPRRRRLGGRHRAEFAAEVVAVARGLIAAGIEPGRPGRPDVPHPLRVDAARLRDLGRGRGHRADLRDVVAPSRSQWILVRLRREGRGRRDRRGTRAIVEPAVDDPPGARVADRAPRRAGTARSTALTARGADVPADDGPRAPARAVGADDLATLDLHLRHHRPAQGLRADPPQPRRRGAAR